MSTPKKIDKATVVKSMLRSFVDEAGFKEQDFLQGVHDMLVGDSHEQQAARLKIRSAIEALDTEDKNNRRKP